MLTNLILIVILKNVYFFQLKTEKNRNYTAVKY